MRTVMTTMRMKMVIGDDYYEDEEGGDYHEDEDHKIEDGDQKYEDGGKEGRGGAGA